MKNTENTSLPTKEEREAKRTFHEMCMLACFLETGKKEVGAITKRLKPMQRESLKHLKPKHIQDRIK